MPNANINRKIVLSGITYDADAITYFTQLNPSPSFSYKLAVNTLIRQLKADGNWNHLDRFWIHATEYQQNARISVKIPSSTAITEVNSPTWLANFGYMGDAATSYLNTNYDATVNAV